MKKNINQILLCSTMLFYFAFYSQDTSAQPVSLFNISGGGSYCAGGEGVFVRLAGSQTRVNYQLKLNGVNTGDPVGGTGTAIKLGRQTVEGIYTVVAIRNSGIPMLGEVTVTVNPLPRLCRVVIGGGLSCSGGLGKVVALLSSQTGVSYQLKLAGSNTGNPVAGTGADISFGNQFTAGTYTVVATNVNTNCRFQ